MVHALFPRCQAKGVYDIFVGSFLDEKIHDVHKSLLQSDVQRRVLVLKSYDIRVGSQSQQVADYITAVVVGS